MTNSSRYIEREERVSKYSYITLTVFLRGMFEILRRDLSQIVKLYMRLTLLASVESRRAENANVLHSSPSTGNFNQL